MESRIQDCLAYMGGIKLWHCSPLKKSESRLIKVTSSQTTIEMVTYTVSGFNVVA